MTNNAVIKEYAKRLKALNHKPQKTNCLRSKRKIGARNYNRFYMI